MKVRAETAAATVTKAEPKFSYNGREVIHWTEDGRECAFCCAVLVGPQAASHRKRMSVVMISGDPCATWVTGRKPTCEPEVAAQWEWEMKMERGH